MLQLKLVILPLDASDELLSMLRQHREKRKANARAPAPTFGIAFMTMAEVRWVRVKVVNGLWEGNEDVSSRPIIRRKSTTRLCWHPWLAR